MKKLCTIFCFIFLFLYGPALFGAQIVLESGEILDGSVQELTDDAVVLSLYEYEGSRIKIPLKRISRYSVYELRLRSIDKKSPQAREKLGDWAMDNGLLSFAMSEYEKAIELAGENASEQLRRKVGKADRACGRDKFERAMTFFRDGENLKAQSYLKDIISNHSDCPVVPEATKLLTEVKKRIGKYGKQRVRSEKESEKELKSIVSALRMANQLVERADDLKRLGLLNAGSFGRAENYYQGAIRSLRKAYGIVRKAHSRPGAEGMKKDLGKLDAGIRKRLVALYVDLGHNYVVKGSLTRAARSMGQALALDPNDPEALHLRRVISESSSSSDRWRRLVR